MEALIKISKARQIIKSTKITKQGQNTFSNYAYFTPEQISLLVHDACEKLNLLTKYDLKRTELGLVAQLKVIDLDSGKSEVFETATEIPEIKATNVAQQMGGMMTYSNRYLLMFAFDIVDNNLDFDSKDGTKSSTSKASPTTKPDDERPWLSEKQLNKVIDRIRTNTPGEEFGTIQEFIQSVKDQFKMKKVYREQIEAELDSPFNKALQDNSDLDQQFKDKSQ